MLGARAPARRSGKGRVRPDPEPTSRAQLSKCPGPREAGQCQSRQEQQRRWAEAEQPPRCRAGGRGGGRLAGRRYVAGSSGRLEPSQSTGRPAARLHEAMAITYCNWPFICGDAMTGKPGGAGGACRPGHPGERRGRKAPADTQPAATPSAGPASDHSKQRHRANTAQRRHAGVETPILENPA